MNRPSSFSLRGRRALAAIKDGRDASIVRRQFDRLGIDMSDWAPGEAPGPPVDVIVIDDDYLPLAPMDARMFLDGCAVVVLLGTETPSRLKLVLDLDPSSFLVKPLRSTGIYAALVMAIERRERTRELQRQLAKMDARLRSRRVVLTAVLQVMQMHALAEPAAFALIRRAAMEQRKTIEQIAADIATRGALPRVVG